MTDLISSDHADTGDIPGGEGGSVYRTDQTAVLPLPEETARLRPDEGFIADTRPFRPADLGDVHRYLPGALDDRPYPPVPPPVPPQPKPSLADELMGEPERPAWAQRGSAGEWPIVRPFFEPGARRAPGSLRPIPARWAWALIGSGATWLLMAAVVAGSVLAGVRW